MRNSPEAVTISRPGASVEMQWSWLHCSGVKSGAIVTYQKRASGWSPSPDPSEEIGLRATRRIAAIFDRVVNQVSLTISRPTHCAAAYGGWRGCGLAHSRRSTHGSDQGLPKRARSQQPDRPRRPGASYPNLLAWRMPARRRSHPTMLDIFKTAAHLMMGAWYPLSRGSAFPFQPALNESANSRHGQGCLKSWAAMWARGVHVRHRVPESSRSSDWRSFLPFPCASCIQHAEPTLAGRTTCLG